MRNYLSKTAALRAARGAYSPIYRRGKTEYVYRCPYRLGNIGGLYSEHSFPDYWRARGARAEGIATTALVLMGVSLEKIAFGNAGSIKDRIEHALARLS